MSEEYNDPSASTQAFRAWVDNQAEAPEAARSKLPLIVGAVVLAAVVLAVVIFLLVG